MTDSEIEITVVDHSGSKAFLLEHNGETIILSEIDSLNFDKGQPTIHGKVSRNNKEISTFWIQQTGGMGGGIHRLIYQRTLPKTHNTFQPIWNYHPAILN